MLIKCGSVLLLKNAGRSIGKPPEKDLEQKKPVEGRPNGGDLICIFSVHGSERVNTVGVSDAICIQYRTGDTRHLSRCASRDSFTQSKFKFAFCSVL